MNVLLDTHIFLWAMLEPERLSEPQTELLGSVSCQVWLSPITIWECLLLAERGRVVLAPEAHGWLAEARARVGAREATLTHAVAARSRQVQLAHQDPADRFLAATASVYDLPLVTADERLLAGQGFPIWQPPTG